MIMFATVFKFFRQALRMIDFVSSSKEQCESIRPFGFTVNTLRWVVCLPHKFSTFNSAEKCGTRGVIVSWLTSKGMFSLFVAFEGVDSEKFNDFLVVGRSLYKFFFAWGLLSGEDTDDGRRRLILTCVSWCEDSGTSTFLSRPERMNQTSSAALNIFLPQDWHFRLDRTLDSTTFRPISEQNFANVLPSRLARPEGYISVEMYLVIFWKLPNFIFRLTPHNLQKSLAFSSWLFLPLTGFAGISLFDVNSPLFAMHASTTKCKTIAFTPIFRAKIVGCNWLV